MAEQTIDEAVEAVAEGESTSPKRSRNKLIFIGAGGLLLVLLAAGGYFYFNGTIGRLMGHPAAEAPPPPKPLVFFDLPDFLVNLNSAGRKSSFLKLSVSLQVDKQEDTLQLQAVLPRIIDNCQIFLRELRVEDLRGSGGIYRLREEMLKRINAVSPVKVDDVLFKEMLVQ